MGKQSFLKHGRFSACCVKNRFNTQGFDVLNLAFMSSTEPLAVFESI
jgi:hypothetical protein